jgi:hypothetical protein
VCVNFNATPGLPGSVCDSLTGACVTPPATPGNCCDNANVDGSCAASPVADEAACEYVGGTFVANAVCAPSGRCVP